MLVEGFSSLRYDSACAGESKVYLRVCMCLYVQMIPGWKGLEDLTTAGTILHVSAHDFPPQALRQHVLMDVINMYL